MNILVSKENFVVNAPGRINLIGEHTDYNGGKVLPFAVPYQISTSFYCSKERTVDFKSITLAVKTDFDSNTFIVSGGEVIDLIEYEKKEKPEEFTEKLGNLRGKWQAYILGCLFEHFNTPGILQKDFPIKVDINISTNLPKGAGLSSSAALCCGLLWGLSHTHGTDHDPIEMAIHAMRVEHRFTGLKCGLMDQIAVSLAKPGKYIEIDFKPFAAGGIPIIHMIAQHSRLSDYTLVILDSHFKHKLSETPYGERRKTCEDALALMNTYFGTEHSSLSEFNEYPPLMNLVYEYRGEEGKGDAQGDLFKVFKYVIFKGKDEKYALRASHVIAENVRVSLAITAIKEGNLELLTTQMNRSHESLRDFYDVSCKEIEILRDEVLKFDGRHGADSERNILGSRMTGGGFGGSIIQYVKNHLIQDLRAHFIDSTSEYEKITGRKPSILVAQPSQGIVISEHDHI